MRTIAKLACAMLTSAIAIASANAADLYQGGGGYKDGSVPYSWTGFTWAANSAPFGHRGMCPTRLSRP